MELYLLHTFAAVAKAGSIRKAAERLHMTSPTASGHIKALEEEFGIALFERNPKGMVLTAEGRALLKQAERVIASARTLQDQASAFRDSVSGELRIGLNAPSALLKAAELAAEVRKHPGIGMTFEPSSTGKILDGLSSGKFDAGFVFGPPPATDIESVYLGTFDLCIAIPSALGQRIVPGDWEMLARLPWVCSDGYCPFQDIGAGLFAHRGLALENTISTNDDMTKLDFVRQGLGVALLLADECRQDTLDGKISVWEGAPIRCGLYFAFPSERMNDPVLDILKKAVRKVWAETDSWPVNLPDSRP